MVIYLKLYLFSLNHLVKMVTEAKSRTFGRWRSHFKSNSINFTTSTSATVHSIGGRSVSFCPNTVVASSHHHWNGPMSWHNIRHWFFFHLKVIDVDYIMPIPKNFLHDFVVWQIHLGLLRRWLFRRKSLFLLLLALRRIVVNLYFGRGSEMSQNVIRIVIKQHVSEVTRLGSWLIVS